jgi:hypothetical protein
MSRSPLNVLRTHPYIHIDRTTAHGIEGLLRMGLRPRSVELVLNDIVAATDALERMILAWDRSLPTPGALNGARNTVAGLQHLLAELAAVGRSAP